MCMCVFRRQEQASWVCECDDVVVHQVETEVKRIFQQHYGLEQWAGWLDEITTHLLQEHIGRPEFAQVARQLILKWTFYRLELTTDHKTDRVVFFGGFSYAFLEFLIQFILF